MKELLAKEREILADKDNRDPEEVKKETSTLQQAPLKLFEMASKKVSTLLSSLQIGIVKCFISLNLLFGWGYSQT